MTERATVSPERWEQIQNIFHAACRRRPDEWAVFLDRACGEDGEIRAEVAELLAAHEGGGLLGQLDDEPTTPLVEQVGPYRVTRPLGEGGMGAVYLAEREGADFTQVVAIKVMRADLRGKLIEERLKSERRILAQLEHPGIVRLIDGGATPSGQPYYAMEYVEGSNIVRHCDQNRLTVDARLKLFLRVCDPVRYAHQQLIVHRDIKPNNILVTADGQPKLLDFGIAKVLDTGRERQATKTGAWFTPAYAAPEQVLGEQVNTLSDVYALGVLLYELLSGRAPYVVDVGTPDEIQAIVCDRMPQPPSAVVGRELAYETLGGTPHVAPPEEMSEARQTTPRKLRQVLAGDLDAIVLKALAKDPTDRYASVEQFADDIRRHRGGRPVLAQADNFRYRTAKYVARHRAAILVAAAALVVLTAYAATVTVQNREVRRALEQAEVEAERASQLSDLLLGLFENPAPSGAPNDFSAARELLERGHARAAGMEGNPSAQAQMLAALGRVHSHLGEYAEAATELERALELHRRLHGDEHLTVAGALVDLAEVYRLLGRFSDAEDAARAALATERRLVGDEHARVARTLNRLSLVLRDAGDYAGAEPYVREALAMRRRLLGDEHADVAESVNYLAALLRRMGDYDAAEPLYREALTMRRRLYGGDHPLLAESINNLALQLNQRGDSRGAESLYREAYAMYVRLFGQEHPFVATTMTNFANVLMANGQLDDAEELHRNALGVRRRAFGDGHPDIATSLNAVGALLRHRGRLTEAREYYRAAWTMRRELLGDEHPAVVINLRDLARVHREQGEPFVAEEYAREAVRIGRAVLGSEHPSTAAALTELGSVLLGRAEYAEAETVLLEALDIRRKVLGDENHFVAESARELIMLYESSGRAEVADRYRMLER